MSDWLTQYQEYTAETESAPVFNTWVGISTIASALRKKTWLSLGRLKVFPNLYIVLVAEPGVARKSQAITYASDIVSEVSCITTSADSITTQALLQDLEESTCYDNIPGLGTIRHASLSVISKEFETFLGGSQRMVVTLTDLFDAGETPWKHRTKNSGTITIPSVFLNILGATTPRSLASCLSEIAVGGGLTSRILFVYSGTKTKKIAVPALTQAITKLRGTLIEGLQRISRITGAYDFTEDGLKFWKEWYENYDELSDKRIQQRYEFAGWYSRKPLMIQKVAIALSASESSLKLIASSHLKKAIQLIEELEHGMGSIFSATTKEESIKESADVLLDYIKQYKEISEKHLLQLVWREFNEDEFDTRIAVLLKDKKCKRVFEHPVTKAEDIWYIYNSEV